MDNWAGIFESSIMQEPIPEQTNLPKIELPNITLLSRLGEGSFARVYLAEHQIMKSKVAVKILQPTEEHDSKWKERFQREGQILSKLQHPNIVRFFTYGISSQGNPYIVMEFSEGQSLDSIIKKEGSFSAERACAIIEKLASALAIAHDNEIVHRDIKPGNIFLKDDGNPLLLDFGISKISTAGSAKLTATSQILGTPAYMSPEQAKGSAVVDHKSDQYSLACVLYFLLSGHTPFTGSSDLEVLMKHLSESPDLESLGISKDLTRILSTAMSKEPGERFASISKFADELKAADLRFTRKKSRAELSKISLACLAVIAVLALLISIAKNDLQNRESSLSNSVNQNKQAVEDEAILKQAEVSFREKRDDSQKYYEKFLLTNTGKTNNRLRIRALASLSSTLADKKRAFELAHEHLKILRGPEANKLFNTLSERDNDEYGALDRLSRLYYESSQPVESLKYANELEAYVKKTESMQGPKTDFNVCLLKSRNYWELGQPDEAVKEERKAFSLLHITFFEPDYFWELASNAARCRARAGRLKEGNEILEEMRFWLSQRNQQGLIDERDWISIFATHGLILKENPAWQDMVDKFLLDSYPTVMSASTLSAEEKIQIIERTTETLQRTQERTLNRTFTRTLHQDLIANLKASSQKGTLGEPFALQRSADVIAKRLCALKLKSEACSLYKDLDTYVLPSSKVSSKCKVLFLAKEILNWEEEGEPTITKQELAQLVIKLHAVIVESARDGSCDQALTNTVGLLRRVLMTHNMHEDAQKLEKDYNKISGKSLLTSPHASTH